MAGKYAPLETYLRELPSTQAEVILSFAEIEGILKSKWTSSGLRPSSPKGEDSSLEISRPMGTWLTFDLLCKIASPLGEVGGVGFGTLLKKERLVLTRRLPRRREERGSSQ